MDRIVWTRRHLIAAAGAAGLAGCATAAIRPVNDQLSGDLWPVHDPCIIKADGLYHLFCTSQMAQGKGLIAWRTSPDMLNWSPHGAVMQAFPDWVMQALPETRGAWAPDISYVDGQYLLYYAASLFGRNRSVIGLMTTPTLDTGDARFGWRDAGLVIESHPGDNYNAIDPNHVVDADGRHWLAFGSFWGGIMLTELDPATHKPKDARALIPLAGRPSHAVEGAFIIQREGWYYLFASYDFCCRGVNSSYYTVVCRSRAVQGPYLDRDGKAMLEGGGLTVLSAALEPGGRFKGPGHCAILHDKGRDYIVYHAYDADHHGRPQLRIRRLDWDAEGWPRAV